MFDTSFVSFGVAVMPIWTAELKYSRILRHAESSAALPRWHSSTMMRAELPEDLFAVGADELLIEGEVDLVCRVELAMLNLRDHLAQRLEVAVDGLVDEDVPVGKVEHLSSQARLAQAMDYLKGGVRLTRAGGHDEKEPVLALGDRFDRSVDRVALIVAGRVAAALVIKGRRNDALGLLRRKPLRFTIALPELVRGRELVHPKATNLTCGEVVLCESLAVGAVGKGDVERDGVVHRLLQAGLHRVVRILRLDYGDGHLAPVHKQIVGLLRFLPDMEVLSNDDFAVGEIVFGENLIIGVPTLFQHGIDELQTHVRLVHRISLLTASSARIDAMKALADTQSCLAMAITACLRSGVTAKMIRSVFLPLRSVCLSSVSSIVIPLNVQPEVPHGLASLLYKFTICCRLPDVMANRSWFCAFAKTE